MTFTVYIPHHSRFFQFSQFVRGHSVLLTEMRICNDLQPWGLFLETHENFSDPKNQSSNCNPLVLKS